MIFSSYSLIRDTLINSFGAKIQAVLRFLLLEIHGACRLAALITFLL